MYCILVTGIPASGKTTMAEFLSERLQLPNISKDKIKELLFDGIGFHSREEKVKLGVSAMEIMYYFAEQLMKLNQPFILENNFENISKKGLLSLLERYSYLAMTITLTGDYERIYQRFQARDFSPDRHRGHVVNDCYPEKVKRTEEELKKTALSYERYLSAIEARGMDKFCANGPQLFVDTTDFSKIDREAIVAQIIEWRGEVDK